MEKKETNLPAEVQGTQAGKRSRLYFPLPAARDFFIPAARDLRTGKERPSERSPRRLGASPSAVRSLLHFKNRVK